MNIPESNVSGTLSEAVHVALRQWRIAGGELQQKNHTEKSQRGVSMAHSVALLLMAPATSIPCASRQAKPNKSCQSFQTRKYNMEAHGSMLKHVEACGSIRKHLQAVAG